jgi:hypothetical protein
MAEELLDKAGEGSGTSFLKKTPPEPMMSYITSNATRVSKHALLLYVSPVLYLLLVKHTNLILHPIHRSYLQNHSHNHSKNHLPPQW